MIGLFKAFAAYWNAMIDARAEAEVRRILGDKYLDLKGMRK